MYIYLGIYIYVVTIPRSTARWPGLGPGGAARGAEGAPQDAAGALGESHGGPFCATGRTGGKWERYLDGPWD